MASQPPPGYDWVDTPPPTPRGPPRIVVPTQPTPRYPEQQVIQQGQAEAAPYEGPRARAGVRNTEVNTEHTGQTIRQSDTGGRNFTDENSLRAQYQGQRSVTDYITALPIAQSSRITTPDGPGDLSLVIAYTKVSDPGTASREGEVAAVQGSGSVADQARGFIQRFGHNGTLSPTMRADIRRQIENRINQYRAAYQHSRKQYARDAEAYGFDMDRIIGQDVDQAYQPGTNAPQNNLGEDIGNGVLRSLGAPPIHLTNPEPPGLGGITATDSRESAQSAQNVTDAASPTSADIGSRTTTPADTAYTEAFSGFINSRDQRTGAPPSREQAQEWLNQNYRRFYPDSQQAPQLTDEAWQPLQRSFEGGQGLNWQAPATGVPTPDELNNERDRLRGQEARAAWAEEHPVLAGVDTVGRRIANTATLGLADHLAARLEGENPSFEHGVTAEDWRSRPVESIGGTMLGGARLPYGSTLPRQMGLGAAYGGATGYNESDGPLSERLGNAYRGGATGLGVNTLVGGLGRAFRAPNADAILEAGARQDITLPRYMLGRETAQVATGAVGATPGRIPLASAARRTIEGIEGARNRAAAEIGDVGDNFSAGRRAQAGARSFLDRTEERAAELYNRIPIAPRTWAGLDNTRAALSEVTEGMESNPRLSALFDDPQLIGYRDALTEGGLSWRDMKDFRTRLGRLIGRAQVASQGPHVDDLRTLRNALTRDMEATAEAQGGRALTMFRRATQHWRGRETRREGVIQDILGRNFDASPEDAYRQINRWAQRDTGDTTALAQTMRSLPRDDANAVRATLFARMGRSTKGQQDETGEAFSPFVFATQWSGLEPRAKALLVPNRSHRRNLDDIALLATTMRRSERFTNTSNTGLGTNLGLFTVGGIANPGAAAGGFGGTYALGRLLSSPAGSATFLRALRNPEAFQGLLQDQEEGR